MELKSSLRVCVCVWSAGVTRRDVHLGWPGIVAMVDGLKSWLGWAEAWKERGGDAGPFGSSHPTSTGDDFSGTIFLVGRLYRLVRGKQH